MNHKYCQHNLRQHRRQTMYSRQALLNTKILENQMTKTWSAIIIATVLETTMMIVLVQEVFPLKTLE